MIELINRLIDWLIKLKVDCSNTCAALISQWLTTIVIFVFLFSFYSAITHTQTSFSFPRNSFILQRSGWCIWPYLLVQIKHVKLFPSASPWFSYFLVCVQRIAAPSYSRDGAAAETLPWINLGWLGFKMHINCMLIKKACNLKMKSHPTSNYCCIKDVIIYSS